MAKSAAPNPFAAAKPKTSASAAKSQAEVIPAQDFTAYDGGEYTGTQVQESIQNFIEGKEQFDQGEAMMKASRPTLNAIGRTFFARFWLKNRSVRPSSPIIATDPLGRGKSVKMIFQDSVAKLDENSYTALASLIGAQHAEELTVKRDDFQINPDVLGLTVKVKRDGKVVSQNVMEAIAEALQEKFAPSPEIVAGLFTVVHNFSTTKGLIDKGPSLVAPDASDASAQKLAQFLEVGRFVTQIKPGSQGE